MFPPFLALNTFVFFFCSFWKFSVSLLFLLRWHLIFLLRMWEVKGSDRIKMVSQIEQEYWIG